MQDEQRHDPSEPTSFPRAVRLLLAVALLAVGFWAAALWPSEAELGASDGPAAGSPDAPDVGSAPGPTRHSTAPSPTPRDGCELATGLTMTYRMELATTTRATGVAGRLPGVPPVVSARTTGLVDLEVATDSVPGDAVLIGRFRDLQGALARPAMTQPFLLRVDVACEIVDFARHDQTTLADARDQQALAYELSFRQPAAGTVAPVAHKGENSFGAYVAQYTQLGPDRVHRRITEYPTLWETEHHGLSRFEPIPSRSERTIERGSAPWFAHITATQVLQGQDHRSEYTLRIGALTPRDDRLGDVDRDLSQYHWGSLLSRHFARRVPRKVSQRDLQARRRVASLSPEEATDAYRERLQDGPFHASWPDLTHYLEARPEHTERFVDMMKRDAITNEESVGVYVALGRARTPQAKASLLGIMDDDQAPVVERTRAMFALVDRDDVGLELAERLGSFAPLARSDRDADSALGRESMLALGAMAGLQHDDAITKLAVGVATAALTEKPLELSHTAYGTLANTGSSDALVAADRGMHSEEPQVRQAAVSAIRRLSPRDTAPMVAEWLGSEADWRVKREIYSTVVRQVHDAGTWAGAAVVERAIADLGHNPGPITRKAIVRILGQAVDHYPPAVEALQRRVPIELADPRGLYNVVARQLPADALKEALAHVR